VSELTQYRVMVACAVVALSALVVALIRYG
jgi:hypothetical protein